MSTLAFCNISCTCGYTGDLEEFTKTSFGDLPRNTYHCPSCKTTWRICPVGETKMLPDGYVIPPQREIEIIQEPLTQEMMF